jgi:hypothetical protein
MRDVYGHFGEFDVLVGVVALGIAELCAAAFAFIGMKRDDLVGIEHLLAVAFVSLLTPGLSRSFIRFGCALCVGTVRRGRLA